MFLNDLELEEIAKEDWVTYRNKIPKFDEHLENWAQKLAEQHDESPIIDWLKAEIESYKVAQFFQFNVLLNTCLTVSLSIFGYVA